MPQLYSWRTNLLPWLPLSPSLLQLVQRKKRSITWVHIAASRCLPREVAVSQIGTPSDHHSYLTSCYAVFATLKGGAQTFPALWRSSWCVYTLS